MRFGLEHSVNIITAHLLDGGIDADPEQSLDDVCATAVAAKIYTDCVRYYPFVLGAQPVHMINLAAFYAAIANGGVRPQPHAIDSIAKDGKTVFAYPKDPVFPKIGAADPASFYQLKTMLQGVVARGTARDHALQHRFELIEARGVGGADFREHRILRIGEDGLAILRN